MRQSLDISEESPNSENIDLDVLERLDQPNQLAYLLELSASQRAKINRRRAQFKSKNPAAHRALSKAAKKASTKMARAKGLKKFFASKSRMAMSLKYRGKARP